MSFIKAFYDGVQNCYLKLYSFTLDSVVALLFISVSFSTASEHPFCTRWVPIDPSTLQRRVWTPKEAQNEWLATETENKRDNYESLYDDEYTELREPVCYTEWMRGVFIRLFPILDKDNRMGSRGKPRVERERKDVMPHFHPLPLSTLWRIRCSILRD